MGCFILIIILSIISQIANYNIIEGLDEIPKFEYTPNRSCMSQVITVNNDSNIEWRPLTSSSQQVSLSDSTNSTISFIPDDGNINIKQLLEDNVTKVNIDCESNVMYSTESDGKTYAFGNRSNPLRFIKSSTEPTTFVKSVWDLTNYIINGNIGYLRPQSLHFLAHFEYNSISLSNGSNGFKITIIQLMNNNIVSNSVVSKTFTIQFKDNKLFEERILKALLKLPVIDSTEYLGISFRSLGVTNYHDITKYIFEIKKKNGNVDTIHMDLGEIIQPLLQQYNEENNIAVMDGSNIINLIREVIYRIDSNIRTIYYNSNNRNNIQIYSDSQDNNKYISGYILYDDIIYFLFVKP